MSSFLTETPFVPLWAKQMKEDFYFIYNGSSMSPLFRPGDVICVRSPNYYSIFPGDVLVYKEETIRQNRYIVHRVTSVKQKYLIAQGDNNLQPDTQVVTKDNLVGMVTFFGRNGHIYPVKGGYFGLIYARLIFARNYICLFIRHMGSRSYYRFRQSGLATKLWRPEICQIRVITDCGPLIKYCYGNRTVAYWWPEKKNFYAVKPFDLVISRPKDQN
jgi:signal peptidase I